APRAREQEGESRAGGGGGGAAGARRRRCGIGGLGRAGAGPPDRAGEPGQPLPEMSRASPSRPHGSRHVESFLEMLAAERGVAAATREAYRRDLAHLGRFLAAESIERASTEDLRRYLASLARAALAPRSVARRLSALRQFY